MENKITNQQRQQIIDKYFPDTMTIYELNALDYDGHIDLNRMIENQGEN